MTKESVWDYPRPPKIEPFSGHIRIIHNDAIIGDTNCSIKLMETSHPPTYYLPWKDLNQTVLVKNQYSTYCEYKGAALYLNYVNGAKQIKNIGWYYPSPNSEYLAIKDHVCFYASKLDTCLVNDEKASAQEGDFYGGWITNNIKGPFKGGKGTFGW